MVKIIQLEREYHCDHLLGKFLDNDAYDIVLNEDTDVYKPLRLGEEQNETNILLKFRKNAFTPEECAQTYAGLRGGATLSDNRGIAAGDSRENAFQILPNGEGKRRWVTKREKEVLEYFIKGSPASLFGDRAQEIYDETPNTPLKGRGGGMITNNVSIKGGSIWIVKVSHEIDFDDWFKEIITKSSIDRKTAAIQLCKRYISDTTYGDGVYSGVGGSMDRYPRIPFCRQTAWTSANKEKFEQAFPLIHKASNIFKKELPIRWAGQNEFAQKLDQEFRIGESVYSTVTINKTFRTACHRDAGDLCESIGNSPRGFSNLTVVTNGKNFDGFYLCFPEYRVAANIQNGDFIMMDAHKIHGNTPLITCDEGFERLSLVFYFREKMLECNNAKMEDLRRKFIYARKDNENHPLWHPGWNGVSPNCFYGDEWISFLKNHGYLDEEIDQYVNRTA